MNDGYVGKTLKNEKDEEYIVLSELTYKNIPCVYAMKVLDTEEEGEKSFFQISCSNEVVHLVNIKSKKMVEALNDAFFKQNENDNVPRKIKEDESIQDYLAYLDDFYKSKVVTII